MPTSSWLIGSIVNFGNQTTDTWTIPQDDLVFLASPIITSSYPGSGTEVTNIAPSSGQVGTITGNTAYSSGYFDSDGVDGDINWAAFTGVNDGFDGDGTAMVWAQADSDGEASAGRIFSKEAADAGSGWSLRARGESGGTADLSFVVRMSGTNGEWRVYNGITIGTKHLLAVQWDSSDPTTAPLIWIDGVAATVSTATTPVGTYDTDASNTIRLGNRTDSNNETWDGPFGLAAFYTRALLQAEHTAFHSVTKGMHGFTSSFVSTPLTFSYDGTYLQHASAPLSMLTTFENALSAAGVDGADVFLGEDGYVHMTGTGVFGVSWSTAGTALRDALGFTGDLAAAASHIAPNLSPLLWVPRRDESPGLAPLGVVGDSTHAVGQVVAPDGTQATREFGSPIRRNRYTWNYIDKDQFWTSSEADGELFAFVRDVCVPGAKFWLYRQTEADYTVTTEVTLGDALGPYEHTGGLRALSLIRAAGFENTDCKFDWTAEVLKTPEYVT